MTWVKICGTTNLEDALLAVEAGADAVGFVFHPPSPRKVSCDDARTIVQKLPEHVEKIGVMVDGDKIDQVRIMIDSGVTGWQTYFSADGQEKSSGKAIGAACLPRDFKFLMALPMSLIMESEAQIRSLAEDFANWGKNLETPLPAGAMDTVVLDSGDLRRPGGTGKSFEWKKAMPIAEGMRRGGMKLVVAGGLTPENVTEAIAILKPWGVDVVSGVEANPGKKDPVKVRAFINAVRAADRSA